MMHDGDGGEGGWFRLAEIDCRRATCVDEYPGEEDEDEDDDELADVDPVTP